MSAHESGNDLMKRFERVWMCALLSLPCMPAFAAPLWEGTIGKAAVVVQFDPAHPTEEGAYFYRRHLLDIRLNRETGGDMMEGEQGVHWRMQAPQGDAWRGAWVGKDGREQPISLHALAVPAAGDDADAQRRQAQALYEKQRLRDLTLKPGARETRGKFQIQWWEEPRSKILSLQVVAGYPEPVRAKINKVLRERQWDDVGSYFQCLSDPHGDEYSQTVTLRYIDTDAISVSIFTSYSCGGAHPDFGDNPVTIDARTGEALQLEDVLYLGKGTPPTYKPNGSSDAFFAYRDKTFAPWLAKTMKQLHPKDMPKIGADGDGCDYNDSSVWQFPSWYLTPAGIYLGPSFARVMRACEYPDWSVLPWKVVRAHAGRIKLGADVAQ